MALPKLFQRIFFSNNSAPALNADNLNSMSKAIDDIDNRLIKVGSDALVIVPQIQAYLAQSEDLVEAMTALSTHPPYIGSNGNWYVWNTTQAQFVDSGYDASITTSIEDITMIDYGATPYVTNSGTSTDTHFHLYIPKPATVSSLEKTSTLGRVDTYTMTLQDGSHFSFDVINGEGSGDMRAADYDTNGDVINAGGIASYANTFANSFAPTYMDGYVKKNIVTGLSHSIGAQSTAYPIHVEGSSSTVGANAYNAHAEGYKNKITPGAQFAHVEGTQSCASELSHAEGFRTQSIGEPSHSEGAETSAYGESSHSEGEKTRASGKYSHAEGFQTCSNGQASHAEGNQTTANGSYSHASGNGSQASAEASMAIGRGGMTRIFEDNKHQKDRLFAIGGNGSNMEVVSSMDVANEAETTHNVFSVDENGNTFLSGFPYLVKGVCNNRLIANGDFFVLEDGASYLLFTQTRMANNGAWRGMQAYYISQPFMPNLSEPGITTSANAVPIAHQFSTAGTAGLTLQRTAVAYDDGTGTTKWHGQIGIGSCVANCCVRYSLLKVVGSEADFATRY
jgi:hypothetical protein